MAMLAEKKRRNKWCLNPRGKCWSDDQTKLGQRLLEKMGWSAGQGLGVNKQGPTENIKVKLKNDNKGLGFKENCEEWLKTTSDYNELLDKLASKEEIEEDQTNITASLEDRSKKSKARVHYHKFTRGKDLSRYSEKDLLSIVGPDVIKANSNGVIEEGNKNGEVSNSNEKVDKKRKKLLKRGKAISVQETDDYTEKSYEDDLSSKPSKNKKRTNCGPLLNLVKDKQSKGVENTEIVYRKVKEIKEENIEDLYSSEQYAGIEIESSKIKLRKRYKSKKRDNDDEILKGTEKHLIKRCKVNEVDLVDKSSECNSRLNCDLKELSPSNEEIVKKPNPKKLKTRKGKKVIEGITDNKVNESDVSIKFREENGKNNQNQFQTKVASVNDSNENIAVIQTSNMKSKCSTSCSSRRGRKNNQECTVSGSCVQSVDDGLTYYSTKKKFTSQNTQSSWGMGYGLGQAAFSSQVKGRRYVANSFTGPSSNNFRGKSFRGQSIRSHRGVGNRYGQVSYGSQMRKRGSFGRGRGSAVRGRISQNNFDAKQYAEKCKTMNTIPKIAFKGVDLQIISGYAADKS